MSNSDTQIRLFFACFSGGQIRTDTDTGGQATPIIETKTAFMNTPGRIRTCDLRIRNPLLYPTELRAQLS